MSAMATEQISALRPRLFGAAYRMLGSRADAEDVLQDVFLRWQSAEQGAIESMEAWLTTATTRLAIDRLRRRKLEQQSYIGPWLPEPLSELDLRTPELAAELDSDVSIALLTLLEALAPDERAAFVLHDVMDDDYADIAEALGKSEAACRQMVHRARERVLTKRRRFQVDDATRRRMLERFIAVANTGDRQQVIALFAADAVMTSDGGGKAVAVRRPLHGAERISWLWYCVGRRAPERRIVTVNGESAIASFWCGQLHSVATIDTDGERIHGFYTIANPDKLSSFAFLSKPRTGTEKATNTG
ncbi:MAG: RNA polymerase sigma factor SigJ [Steroidobacteraceae bacterium]